MITKDKIEQIAKEENKSFIKISRVPTHIKELFTEIAEGEFCGDYGMLLRECLLGYLEYQRVKDVLLDKEFMTYILENKPKNEQKEFTEEPKKRQTFGNILEKRREERKGGKE